MPVLEHRVSCGIGMGGLEGSGANSKRSKLRAATTFISFMANCCPMQFLWQAAQSDIRLWVARGMKCSALSGQWKAVTIGG